MDSVCSNRGFTLALLAMFACADALMLASCGGGGGAAPPAPPLAFALPGPLQKTYGDSPFTDLATGGAGTGAITYSTSNASVGRVGATTGTVTITGAGNATITATKAADGSANSQQVSYSLTVTKASQSITVSNANPLAVFIGQPQTSPVTGGAGTGAFSYSSNNTAVITVDASSGVVLAVAPGSAQITVDKAGDANYNAAAQATFTVDAIPKTIQLHGWIGISDTVVSAVPAVPTVGLFRSASASCDLSQYSSCPQGQFNVFGSSTIADSAATLSRPAYYWLQHGPYISNPALITPTKFSPRAQAQMIAFNGRLWVIGGYDGQLRNDVWSSADGSTWTQVLANAPFSARDAFALAVFTGRLWLIGGYDGTSLNNEIWSTRDGLTWTQVTVSPNFSPRSGHGLIALQNRLWLIGGADNSGAITRKCSSAPRPATSTMQSGAASQYGTW